MRPVLQSIALCGGLLAVLSLGACQSTAQTSAPPTAVPVVAAETMPTMNIELQLTARSLGYKIELVEVRQSADTLFTLSRLSAPTGMVGMALETLTVNASVQSSASAVRHLVIGPASAIYEPPANVAFFADPSQLPEIFLSARPVAVQP